MRRGSLGTLLALSLLALSVGACRIATYTPSALVVPVSFEAHLLTARECEFRGTVNDPRAADTLGANVVLAFIADVETHSETSTTERRGPHGGSVRWSGHGYAYATLRGKALACPEHVVATLIGWLSNPEAGW